MASTAKQGKPGIVETGAGPSPTTKAAVITKVNGDGTVDAHQDEGGSSWTSIPFVAEGGSPPSPPYFQAVDYTT